jgi:hypothetical protein
MELQTLSSENGQNIIIKNFKNALEHYKKRIKQTKENLKNKEKIDSILITDKNLQNEKLIYNEDIAYSSFNKLENVKRTTFEMESISIDTAKGVYENTEKIKSAKGKLLDINTELSTSNSLISRMLRREYRNKILLLMFAFTLIIIFLTIIYMKFFNSTGEPTTESTEIPIPGNRRFLYIKNK